MGKCKRVAASRSPGDSNATAGYPNVVPSKDASEPPREWPTRYMLAMGNIIVTFAIKS
jgi:hypothetical protein